MIVIPAIDLKDGNCVRLRQGDMDQSTIFSSNPVEQALYWQDEGAKRLHIVDLNGSFNGALTHFSVVSEITQALSIEIEIGGGIRSLQDIDKYLQAGVRYVIIGTKAIADPAFIGDAVAGFGDAIIVGIDARNNKVATEGWQNVSQVSALDLAQQCVADGCRQIIYTDISKDGMMQGVNLESTSNLAQQTGANVIASGGVSSLQDIKNIIDLRIDNITGAVVGRALYDNAFTLKQAQDLC